MSLFLSMLFSLWLLFSSVSYAQTELNNLACILELEVPTELSTDTPIAFVSFNLPNHLKIPLIDLTRLRIKLAQELDQTYLHHHYLNELKKLKVRFLIQGYTETFFDETYAFFFRELSQKNGTLQQEIETKKSLAQKQKDVLYPLKGRTPQVVEAIVKELKISEEDVTIQDLKRITELDLKFKNITELCEGDFQGLTNLKKLYLENNPLTALPERVLQGLGALEKISLRANQLTALPQNVFWGLSSLIKLDLSFNQLTELPENVFRGLRALKTLFLSYNQLRGLPQTVFQGLGALGWLYLSSNPISVISKPVFSAPGLNQNFKIILFALPLDENTKQMLRKKYRNQIEGPL